MKSIFLAVTLVAALVVGTFGSQKTTEGSTLGQLSNVCVVYSINGIFSGGIPVVSPDWVTYRNFDHKGYWVTFSGQKQFKVDTVNVSLLPPDQVCLGIV